MGKPIKALFGGPLVDFFDRSGSASAASPADPTCTYTILAAGTESLTGGSPAAGRVWLLRGASASYQVLAHINSGPGLGANTTGSNAFDTWFGADTTPLWQITRTSDAPNINTLVLAMQCRRTSDSVVIDTWTMTLQVEVT